MKNSELTKNINNELTSKNTSSKWKKRFEKIGIAALGAIPWVGGIIAAMASMPNDELAEKQDNLRTQWLKEHEAKLEILRLDLDEIAERLENLGPEIDTRIQSQEYLSLVKQGFKVWDQAETNDKRKFVRNILCNAAGSKLCSDDILRLFINWLKLYHEAHFAIIRQISQNPGSTRYEIWTEIYGDQLPREDSAEADLYKLLIRDLSTGGVIRQVRNTNEAGQFLKHKRKFRKNSSSPVLKSAFDDKEQYLLTKLGEQFVHYTMNEVVPRLKN